MKQSNIEWLGDIPKDWKCQRAKTIFKQRNSKGNENATLLAATQKYGMYPQDKVEGVVQVKANTDLQQFRTVRIGDFVISLRSFQGGFEISNYEGVCSPAYQVFYSVKKTNNNFYKYLFKSDGFISKINSLTTGIREGKNILYEDFSSMLIPVPPFTIQASIVAYLDKQIAIIDRQIEANKKAIDLLGEYRASEISQMITKCNGIKIPIKRIAKLFNGKEIDIEVNESETSYPVYGSGGIFKHTDNYMYDGEAVLFGRKGSIGKPMIVKGKFWAVDTMYYSVCSKQILSKFFYYTLTVFPWDLLATQTALPSIVGTQVFAEKIVLPELTEQKEIVAYLDKRCKQIDQIIAYRKTIIEKLEEYKKSLIYEAVTGKKEI